jgi:hypothetical protein
VARLRRPPSSEKGLVGLLELPVVTGDVFSANGYVSQVLRRTYLQRGSQEFLSRGRKFSDKGECSEVQLYSVRI